MNQTNMDTIENVQPSFCHDEDFKSIERRRAAKHSYTELFPMGLWEEMQLAKRKAAGLSRFPTMREENIYRVLRHFTSRARMFAEEMRLYEDCINAMSLDELTSWSNAMLGENGGPHRYEAVCAVAELHLAPLLDVGRRAEQMARELETMERGLHGLLDLRKTEEELAEQANPKRTA